ETVPRPAVPKAPKGGAGYTYQLSFLGSGRGFGAAVATREFLSATRRIDKFLFAREKWMTSSTDADFNVPTCRARVIDRAACTYNIGLVILRMNARFHDCERARNLRVGKPFRKR